MRTRAARRRPRGRRRSGRRRPPRAPPPRCPARSASSCRRRRVRAAPRRLRAWPAPVPLVSASRAKTYGTTWSDGRPAADHSSHAVRRNSTSAGSCTASSAESSCATAATSVAPAASSASRIASARAGTSVAGVRVPTQTSASGSWRRQSSLQTNGSIRVAPCHGRARTSIVIGTLEPGPRNSIADVGVTVGHVTVERTGVTAVVPPSLPAAGRHGRAQRRGRADRLARDPGVGACSSTPVYLTSTHAVGRVYDGAVSVAMAADPRVGVDDVVIPVVGECDDSWLSDARVKHVQPDDVAHAVADASLDFEQGAVGAGAGMSCFDWKGGIGSSSRRAGEHTVGVLLLTNFGTSEQLRVDGVPIGELLDERPDEAPDPGGSCIAVRRDRRAARAAAARAARAPRRPRARAGRLRRAPRKRRDLRRVRDVRASARSATGSSIRSSRPPSTRPRRRCSARSGRRSTRPGARAGSSARCRGRRCSSSTAAAAGSRRRAAARGPARRGPSPPRAG